MPLCTMPISSSWFSQDADGIIAAAVTVALLCSVTMIRSARPYPSRYSFAFSNAIVFDLSSE